MDLIWHNGEIKRAHEPVFDITDRIRLGDGVFDTLLVTHNEPQHAKLHFDRLLHAAQTLHIETPHDASHFTKSARVLIEAQKHPIKRGALNTYITRGPDGAGLGAQQNSTPQIVMRLRPAPEPKSSITLITAQSVRRNEGSPLCRIKSMNYGDNILAQIEAQQRGADDALMLNNAGHATCTTMANFYALIDGQLLTPPVHDGVLPGIMRGLLLDQNIASERTLDISDLQKAEGLYISNSLRGFVPVSQFDGRDITSSPLDLPEGFYE